jgi:hypothetical protein
LIFLSIISQTYKILKYNTMLELHYLDRGRTTVLLFMPIYFGHVQPAYNPYFSACFFSETVFFSKKNQSK